jgi:hypothetical protein
MRVSEVSLLMDETPAPNFNNSGMMIVKHGDRVRVKQLAHIHPSYRLRNGVVIADRSSDGSTEVKFDDETVIHVFRKEELEQETDL